MKWILGWSAGTDKLSRVKLANFIMAENEIVLRESMRNYHAIQSVAKFKKM